MDERDHLRVGLVCAPVLMVGQRIQSVDSLASLLTRGLVPLCSRQADVAQRLKHHDAGRVPHHAHVEHRVLQKQVGRRLLDNVDDEDHGRDDGGVRELLRVPVRVLVEVLHLVPERALALTLHGRALQVRSQRAVEGLPCEDGDALNLKVPRPARDAAHPVAVSAPWPRMAQGGDDVEHGDAKGAGERREAALTHGIRHPVPGPACKVPANGA